MQSLLNICTMHNARRGGLRAAADCGASGESSGASEYMTPTGSSDRVQIPAQSMAAAQHAESAPNAKARMHPREYESIYFRRGKYMKFGLVN